ncbi:MAG: YkgJ family cysteine cluster protein [Verrucomicrobiaceae bacterium]|nr:YkgJ family cysteine cluster protein [Verrucomicrobiaceae bacterium]
MKPSSSLSTALKEQIRQIYADLEARPLPRACQLSGGCCRFKLTGRTPSVTRVEALYAAVGVRAAGRTKLQPRADGACSCLGKDGRCTIYQNRPFGCRTHFCEEAGGMYPRKHVADLIRRLEALDVSIGWRNGPRDFPEALEDALEDWK